VEYTCKGGESLMVEWPVAGGWRWKMRCAWVVEVMDFQ
jgi:hypothetical protein